MEDLVLTIPTQDGAFIETLAQRMGWTMRRRAQHVRRTAAIPGRREAAMLFVQNLSVRGGQPVPAGDHLYDIPSPAFSGVTISAAYTGAEAIATAFTDASVKTGCVDFIGTYSPVTLPGGDQTKLYLGAQNTLYWPSADMPVNACRAYFQLHDLDTSTIRAFNLSFGDGSEDTGIGHTEDDGEYQSSTEITEKAGAWYSLDGRKLNGKPTKKGLYIHGGRKFVVP